MLKVSKLLFIFDRFCYWLAVGFGIGKSSIAPGTVGTVAIGVPLVWIWLSFFPPDRTELLSILLLGTLLSVLICDRADRQFDQHDSGAIVLDEVVGLAWGLGFLPVDPLLWLLAILVFRVLDIKKPYPIAALQRLRGGWGIVADDVLAGIMTAAVMTLIF